MLDFKALTTKLPRKSACGAGPSYRAPRSFVGQWKPKWKPAVAGLNLNSTLPDVLDSKFEERILS